MDFKVETIESLHEYYKGLYDFDTNFYNATGSHDHCNYNNTNNNWSNNNTDFKQSCKQMQGGGYGFQSN